MIGPWLTAVAVAVAGLSERSLPVRTAPDAAAALRGWTEAGEPFHVHDTTTGRGCDDAWLVVDAGGYVCRAQDVAETVPRSKADPELVVRVRRGDDVGRDRR